MFINCLIKKIESLNIKFGLPRLLNTNIHDRGPPLRPRLSACDAQAGQRGTDGCPLWRGIKGEALLFEIP